jgi:hypothetical protein
MLSVAFNYAILHSKILDQQRKTKSKGSHFYERQMLEIGDNSI